MELDAFKYDKIYIIESSDNRIEEGPTLQKGLELFGLTAIYLPIKSSKDLEDAINKIIVDFYESKGKLWAMPYIHVSCHGDKDGIELHSKEVISWIRLRDLLDRINNTLGGVMVEPFKFSKLSRLTICMSSCEGFNGVKMASYTNNYPYQSLIGPNCMMSWESMYLCFLTFYFHSMYYKKPHSESVIYMNKCYSEKKLFEIDISPEIDKISRNNL